MPTLMLGHAKNFLSHRDRVRNGQVTVLRPVAHGKSVPEVSWKCFLALKIEQRQKTIPLLDVPCKAWDFDSSLDSNSDLR